MVGHCLHSCNMKYNLSNSSLVRSFPCFIFSRISVNCLSFFQCELVFSRADMNLHRMRSCSIPVTPPRRDVADIIKECFHVGIYHILYVYEF